MTINEIKEILMQMYAYAGFPRSLNGINTFMRVLEERKQQGIKDELGKEANPLPTNIDKDKYGEEVRLTVSSATSISNILRGCLRSDIRNPDMLA